MHRVRELIALVRSQYPDDPFFDHFEETLGAPGKRQSFLAYERAFQCIDDGSWKVLCAKALAHFMDHRKGQRKQGFFNQLNDAFAYQYLVGNGCQKVRIRHETGKVQPDIQYFDNATVRYCEVKTIGVSDSLIARRERVQACNSSIYNELPPEFLSKLRDTLTAADSQIKAVGSSGLCYLIVYFDDFTLEHYETYREQIESLLRAHPIDNVYIKVGILDDLHIVKPPEV